MALAAGTRLGVYEIIAKIGAGGMGEVYRARDTRLNRDVAIKALPEALATDPQRIARFEREAQVLATLNHQHIGQIYGVEEVGGQRYFVLEFVEGRSLADVIRAGALPFADALALARQILDALDTAHDKGIVHRDLKPANIMVRADGVAKVLDFGLARVAVDPAIDPSDSPTKTYSSPTEAGVILGTAPYMSPEQAKGQVADRRSDVWAFGCVFYEMLSGRRAFAGDGVSDTLAAVLRGDPDWSALPKDVPPGVRTLIQRCLARDRKARVPEIAAARFLLEDAVAPSAVSAVPSPATPTSRLRERVWMASAILLAIIGASAGAWMLLRPTSTPDRLEFTIPPPEGERFLQSYSNVAISPDGQRVAFTTSGTDNQSQLWVRNLDDRVARLLAVVPVANQLFWSYDGRFIAFVQSGADAFGKLRSVDVTTGKIETLTAAAAGTGAWNASGVIITTSRDHRLCKLPASGGECAQLTELDESKHEKGHWWPIFLPDGQRFLYQALSSDKANNAWYLSSLDEPSKRTRIAEGTSSLRYAQGRLFFQTEGKLMTQLFDQRNGLVGGPVEIADNVDFTPTNGRASFSVSSTGTIVYREKASRENAAAAPPDTEGKLRWLDPQGKPADTLGEPGSYAELRFSPDGRRLAVVRGFAADTDIWTIDVERNISSRLTTDPHPDRNPVWSLDGSILYFSSTRTSIYDIYQQRVGSTIEELVFQSRENKTPTSVSKDGVLLFHRNIDATGNGFDIWGIRLSDHDGQPFPIVATDSDEMAARVSPDGQWISYVSNRDPFPAVYVRPFHAEAQTQGTRVSPEPKGVNRSAEWSPDGKRLYYSAGNMIKVVDMTSPDRPGPPQDFAPYPASGLWAVSPKTGRVLIVEKPTPSSANDRPLIVRMNWTAGLKK